MANNGKRGIEAVTVDNIYKSNLGQMPFSHQDTLQRTGVDSSAFTPDAADSSKQDTKKEWQEDDSEVIESLDTDSSIY